MHYLSEKEKLLPGDTVDSLGLTLKATTIVQEDILSGSTIDEDGDDILGAYGNEFMVGRQYTIKGVVVPNNYEKDGVKHYGVKVHAECIKYGFKPKAK